MSAPLLALLVSTALAAPPDPETAPQDVATHDVTTQDDPGAWRQLRSLRRVLQIWERGRRATAPLTAPVTPTQHDYWINDGAAPGDRAGGPQP